MGGKWGWGWPATPPLRLALLGEVRGAQSLQQGAVLGLFWLQQCGHIRLLCAEADRQLAAIFSACRNTSSIGESPPSPTARPRVSFSRSLRIRARRPDNCPGPSRKSQRCEALRIVPGDVLSD